MPAQPPAPLPLIRFSDFTPGISDVPGVNYRPEQAMRTNTYRCIANRTGALTPLPRQDTAYAGIDYESANPDAGYYLINGFYVPPYTVVPETSTDPVDPDGRFHPIFLSVSYVKGGNFKEKVELFRFWDNPHTNTTVKSTSDAAGTNTGAQGFGATFGLTRANQTTPTSPGVPVVVVAWGNLAPARAFVSIFPSDLAPTVDGVFDVTTAISLPIATVHQGRIVISEVTNYGFGAQGVGATSENLQWTDVGNPGALNIVQSFVPENPNGYAVLHAMSANELFGLKQTGATLMVGDLNSPTVSNLPMVPGTIIVQTATPSPLGLIYGSEQSGVWVWQHGDSSTLLSPNLLPNFWMVATELLAGNRYHFECWDDWIIVPNNWVFDTLTKSWWRLENEATFQITKYGRYDKFLYGAKRTYTHAALTAFYSWRKDLGAASYSWQSQPIWETIDRVFKVREIELVAKGQGTVIATLTASDNSTQSHTFTLANTGFPERFRTNFALQGRYLQLRLVADSGSASVDAPTVFEVMLHPEERARMAVT